MIGIFDSGVGGLTVVKEVLRQIPQYQTVYFGDTARAPYGNKSPELITAYAIQNVEFLISKGANLIIMGCNTASAVATDAVKKRFPHVPIFDVITPAIKKALATTVTKRVGIIGTNATITSNVYPSLIHEQEKHVEVLQQACPLLVPLVEENWVSKPETTMIVRRYLTGLKARSLDTLILGCTHYPLLRQIIQRKVGKKVRIVDPADETVKGVKHFIETHPEIDQTLTKDSRHVFYFSDLTPKVRDISYRWLGQHIEMKKEQSG
ncbi:MAG: glutamate racemase [Patescibacteria group bacterium]|jgi:glutamate racemase